MMITFVVKRTAFSMRRYCTAIVRGSQAEKNDWKSVIGLEVHAQIATKSKLFSGSGTNFGTPVNTAVSFFDASTPGTLPVLNRSCVEAGVKTALALNCRINPVSMFDRKHYFYADLPAGYQITQQRSPIARDGHLKFPVFVPGVNRKPYHKSVRLHQLQLEQDSGKSLHDGVEQRSLVDLNRAGIPLMELVFEPDLSDAEEAAALVKELVLILSSLETCSCRMEEGALRVDANISLHKEGEPYGIRTEVKNIGSVRNLAQAVSYEIERQKKILDAGDKIVHETRSWDAVKRRTVAMRDKEVQQDYRFMPEPNLPPLQLISSDNDETLSNPNIISVNAIRKTLPELPETTRQHLFDSHQLPVEICIILVNEPDLLNYFSGILIAQPNLEPKKIANFLINDLLTFCNKISIDIAECKITKEQFIELFELMNKKTINLNVARNLLQNLHENPDLSPNQVIIENNLTQINDVNQLEKICRDAIEANPKAVQQYKSGKKKVLLAIAGDISKKTEKRANMALVVKLLENFLK